MKTNDSSVIRLLLSIVAIFLVMFIIIFIYQPSSNSSPNTTIDMESTTVTGQENPTTDNPNVIFDVYSILAESDFDTVFISDDYKKCLANGIRPTISIDSDFNLTKDIIITDPVNIVFTTNDFNSEANHRIIIDTHRTAKINIDCNISNILETSLSIEGLSLEVIWNNEVAPSIKDAYKYLNVNSYNGIRASSYDDILPGGLCDASITDISYYKNNSKNSLFEGTEMSVTGNVITVRIPHEVKDSELSKSYLDFTTNNGTYEIIGATSDYLSLNFGDNDIYVKLTDNKGHSRNYKLYVERKSYGIPVVYISTEAPVLNKTDYVRGCMTIDGVDYPLRIKGRGNSSWMFPKKAYRIKLDDKANILGMEDDKDWVLVSSYADKSLIRNCIATDMSNALDNLEYTPAHTLIDFFYNGEYMGVYTLAEKIEEGKKKVDLSAIDKDTTSDENAESSTGEDTDNKTDKAPMDIGFLIEYGWDFGKENVYGLDYFDTAHTIRLFVKEPEITTAFSPEMKYIMKYMKELDTAIVSGGNYEDYIDMDSWVDWFILVELANNTEVSFYRSCYLYKREGGKVYMGPIWDYDMAFGNFLGDIQTYDKWCSGEATYTYTCELTFMRYLVKDAKFMSAVKARWNEIKDELLQTGLDAADKYSAMLLNGSADQNFKRWNIMKQQIGMGASNYWKYNTFELQIQYIKEFLNKRYEWMDKELNTKW